MNYNLMKIKRRLLNMAKTEKITDRLHREDGTNSTYQGLLNHPGPLKNNKKHSKDIFLLALAFGYERDLRVPINKKDDFINKINFGETLLPLINALAITHSEKGLEILGETSDEIYEIAEEYANGGLEILNSEYLDNHTEFIELLRLKILNLNKDNEIINKLNEMEL